MFGLPLALLHDSQGLRAAVSVQSALCVVAFLGGWRRTAPLGGATLCVADGLQQGEQVIWRKCCDRGMVSKPLVSCHQIIGA